MPQEIKAAVLHDIAAPFQLETLTLKDPGEGEIRVKIVSTGICHTDIKVSKGYGNVPLPVVLGHEGAGVVEALGPNVESLEAGDHVILSFPFCGHCPQCDSDHPAYCDNGQALSFSCQGIQSPSLHNNQGEIVHGYFFGQSSFATQVITSERNIIKVSKDLPLETLGPLGCGFQTGAGAILNVLQPDPGQSLAVFGAGNVGLSAIMAAKIAAMDPVIAVDTNARRLQLALELGATHVLNLTEEINPLEAIRAITRQLGVNYSLDTTNKPEVVRQAFECLANRGTCVHSGGGGKDLCFPGSQLLHGRTVTGVIQGDSVPQTFIPQLLDYHRNGTFPFEKLLSVYALADINKAVQDMEQGLVVKPVLLMKS